MVKQSTIQLRDYFVYSLCTIFIVMPVLPELYSNYYKLITINEACSDFKGPHMSKDLIYGLLGIVLIFSIYMLIIQNIKTLYKSWSNDETTEDLLNAFIAYMVEGLKSKKNNHGNGENKNRQYSPLRVLATLLVLGSTGFYVTSTAKASYKDLVHDFGCSRSGAMAFAFFAMLGAGIGGTYYALRKTQDTLPFFFKLIFGNIEFKNKKEKFTKLAQLLCVLVITLASSPFYYLFSFYAFSSVILAVTHTVFLTTVVFLTSMHGIYQDNIKAENSGKKVNNLQKAWLQKRKTWKEYGLRQKFFFIIALTICTLISLTSLLVVALSGATGWKTALTKWHWMSSHRRLPLLIVFCGAAVALGVGRYFFAHVKENTLEMHNDVCRVGETIAQQTQRLNSFGSV